MNETLPDNNNQINLKTFVLDPLSVIIKLAIIGNKPVGTKILISKNINVFSRTWTISGIMSCVFQDKQDGFTIYV